MKNVSLIPSILAIFLVYIADLAVSGGIVPFTSSNLPIVIIDTQGREILDEPKINAFMGIIDNGAGVRNYVTDSYNDYRGMIGIEIRGSSTQMFPKKQYAVETRDIQGNDSTVSLLGFPPEDDWILYAPYSDKSLIRNVLAYRLSNDMGWYASRTRFCEVVLNGDYRGVYILMEKIKRDKNRVDISKLKPTENTGDDITGGYIIKIDKMDGAETEGWESAYAPVPRWWQRIFYQYHYPDQDDISRKQKEYIQSFIYNYESLMKGPDYADLQKGYSRYINVDSFVDNFIIIEMSKNIDGYRLSTFFHKDRDSKDGRLTMGPVWDYNLAFGNADYYNADVIHGWQIDFREKEDFWQIPFWWQNLMADPNFVDKIYSRWHRLRQDILNTSRIISIIDSLAAHIDEAQKRNFKRWDILGTYVWPNPYIGGSYYAEIRYLKYWLQNRIIWMDMNLQKMQAVDREENFPAQFALKQNHPNPFNSRTQIDYILRKSGNVRLAIYDLLGKHIKTLVNNPQQAGHFQVRWDGLDENGFPVSAGVYFCQMEADEFFKTIKLVIAR